MVNVTKKDIVGLGSTVVININGINCEYTISELGHNNINKGEISSESPVGKGVLGHKKDELVEIILPENRKIKCKILRIKI